MKHGRALAQKTLSSEKIRFGLVGVVNTVVDFAVLFTLARVVGIPVIAANILSTSCAMVASYVLNKNAVFGNTDRHNHRQVLLFVAVTLAGLWVLQSAVIVTVETLLSSIGNHGLVLLLAKVVATGASLVWNYLWYSRVVFKKERT